MQELTPQQFESDAGTGDWRALNSGADAWFATASHSAGAAFVLRVAELADAANHHPDVDLRANGVHLRLFTHETNSLTERDAALARDVSALAAELGLVAEPDAVQRLQLTIDTLDHEATAPFWQAALGYDRPRDDRLTDPRARHPSFWFQQLDAPRPLRNRIHVDAGAAAELNPARVEALESLGGKVTHATSWHNTVADPEGNEVDVFPLQPDASAAAPATPDWGPMPPPAPPSPPPGSPRAAGFGAAAAALADAAGLPLLLDLRYSGVTVDSGKDQQEAGGFAALAASIQAVARELGLAADPSGILDFQLGIDALDIPPVREFWRVALNYVEDPRADVTDLYDPRRLNPPVFFQQMDEPRPQRNRIHLDLFVPADQAEARVAAAVAAGGRITYDEYAPDWWTITDPEGNELDIAVAVGRAERQAAQEPT